MSDILFTVLGSVGAAGGATAAVMAYISDRGTLREGKRRQMVRELVHADLEPLILHNSSSDSQLTALMAQITVLTGEIAKMHDRQAALMDRITVLETKMDVFWKNVALDVARVLHSPDPARAHVDELLEALMDGRLDGSDRAELKRLLRYIRDHHDGDPSDFPVYPGDQIAAAILLQTMDMAEV